MGGWITKLWTDEAYFRALVRSLIVGVFGVLIPNLPLGDLGQVGFWIGKLSVPIALLVTAGDKTAGQLRKADTPTGTVLADKIDKVPPTP